jgi:hypothetical protein
MTQNISINTRMAGIPPGCNRYGRMVRGCRRVAPQPPDMEIKTYCIPEGCQPTCGDATFANATKMLRSLRDRFHRGASWSGGVGALRLNPRLMAGIPPGCNRYGRMVRGCRRVAPQPPANGGHPSGMHPPQTEGLPAISRWSRRVAPTPPDLMPRRLPQTGGLPAISRWSRRAAPTPPDLTPRRFPQTGGLPAVSRWSRRAAPTPPDQEGERCCIPKGCQP